MRREFARLHFHRWLALLLLASALLLQVVAFGQSVPGHPSDAPPAAAPPAAAPPAAARQADIEAFVREGCPHCVAAEAFLAALGIERPELTIAIRDVGKDPAALVRLQELAQAQGAAPLRVPALFVHGQFIVGYSPEAGTDRLVRAALAAPRAPSSAPSSATPAPPLSAPSAPEGAAGCDVEGALSCKAGPEATTEPQPFEVTLLGRTIALDDVGLPLFTVVMGLLDGLNPCSMWVLLLMISLLAPLNDRRRMLAIAGTFVLIQGAAYYAFMAAWLNLFLFIGLSRASELAIAAIAIVAGMVNLKDTWAFGRGFSLSIPDAAKPGIYARMRGILQADDLTAALVGTLILGLLVQFVELLCTSGFPALFTRILTLNELEGASYYGYLLLYNAAYMLDDVVVLTIGVVTLSRHRLQEREGRWLKLVSGLAMVGLGAYLAFRG